MESYDGFQRMKLGLGHLRLRREDVLSLVPGLAADGLLGAVSFDEWWVDAEGLVAANLDAARGLGAEVFVETRVVELLREGGAVAGVLAEGPDGGRRELRAPVTINAAGPWIDHVSRLAGPRIPLRLRQGTHLVYDRPLSPFGLILEARDRERFIFVLPNPRGTLIGPTDLDAPPEPDALRSSDEEIRYLADSARR